MAEQTRFERLVAVNWNRQANDASFFSIKMMTSLSFQ
jgi:hypothetical protein